MGNTVINGDFRRVSADWRDGFAQMVITDPPYKWKDIHLFADAASLAAHILDDGGWFLTYTGDMYLPQVLENVAAGGGPKLKWWWKFNVRSNGQISRVWSRRVCQTSKVVLCYRKMGGRPPKHFLWTDFTKDKPAKGLHRWQQGIGFPLEVMSRWLRPRSLVVDPMAGTGTFLAAAKMLGHRYLGCELDMATYATCVKRLEQTPVCPLAPFGMDE